MLEDMKAALKKSQERLDGLVDKLEGEFEELSDEAGQLWQSTKPKLKAMQESLASSAQSLHNQTDEARLQAHLAMMDAEDQWQHLSKTVTELARHAAAKGSYEIQHGELQAHLAAMEARDFVNTKGEAIRQDFKTAKDKIEKASQQAASALEKSLETIGDAWAKTH